MRVRVTRGLGGDDRGDDRREDGEALTERSMTKQARTGGNEREHTFSERQGISSYSSGCKGFLVRRLL